MKLRHDPGSWERLEMECRRICDECRNASWDGYGAEPISEPALEAGLQFLTVAAAAGAPPPEVCPTCDGCLCFEWHGEPGTLAASVPRRGWVDFAFLGTPERQHGSGQFAEGFPPMFTKLLCLFCEPN